MYSPYTSPLEIHWPSDKLGSILPAYCVVMPTFQRLVLRKSFLVRSNNVYFFFRESANKTLFMTYNMLCPSKEVGKYMWSVTQKLKRYFKNNNHNKNALRRSPLRLTMNLNMKPITLTVETGESWLTRATISFSFLHDTNAFVFARVGSAVVNYEWDWNFVNLDLSTGSVLLLY